MVLGPRYCFSLDNFAPAGGRTADKSLRSANNAAARAGRGGVSLSPTLVVWGLELVGWLEGLVEPSGLYTLEAQGLGGFFSNRKLAIFDPLR